MGPAFFLLARIAGESVNYPSVSMSMQETKKTQNLGVQATLGSVQQKMQK